MCFDYLSVTFIVTALLLASHESSHSTQHIFECYTSCNGVDLAFDLLRKKQSVEILCTLLNGAKGIREIREAIGGSYTTIGMRVKELLEQTLVKDELLTDLTFGKKPSDKRLISLTPRGYELAKSLVDSGFLKLPKLSKDRQKWIILLLHSLKTVRGRTRLIKLLFLLKHEMGCNKSNPYRFRPGKFGPFSKAIVVDLEDLESGKLIRAERKKYPSDAYKEEETIYIYQLRSKSEELIKELSERVPVGTMSRFMKLGKYNAMPLRELLRHVYENYPRFITNSIIVQDILRES